MIVRRAYRRAHHFIPRVAYSCKAALVRKCDLPSIRVALEVPLLLFGPRINVTTHLFGSADDLRFEAFGLRIRLRQFLAAALNLRRVFVVEARSSGNFWIRMRIY